MDAAVTRPAERLRSAAAPTLDELCMSLPDDVRGEIAAG